MRNKAIGHSTNLITSDSNIIVIRGGGIEGRSVYQQMLRAMEDFFPESDIPVQAVDDTSPSEDQDNALRRVDTGITSIVGSNNGDRPGGFVLVIDGTALGHVSHLQLLRTPSNSLSTLFRR